MTKEEKQEQISMKIFNQLVDMLENKDCPNHISGEDIQEDPNYFFNALANIVPAMLFNQTTEEQVDVIGFNHIANRLWAQYMVEVALDEAKEAGSVVSDISTVPGESTN